jgi:hypothetical protein
MKQKRDEENYVDGRTRNERKRRASLRAEIRRGIEEGSCPLCLEEDAKPIPLKLFEKKKWKEEFVRIK